MKCRNQNRLYGNDLKVLRVANFSLTTPLLRTSLPPIQTDMKTISILFLVIFSHCAKAQDTFSICAFDPQTGEVGSAGATCIESSSVNCIIISDVHPGIGVVHTQAYWIPATRTNAEKDEIP